MRFLLRLAVSAAALAVATAVLPGIQLTAGSTTSKLLTLTAVALIFGVINAVLKPIIKTIGCLFYILTLGLVALVVNALLLWLASAVAGWLSSISGRKKWPCRPFSRAARVSRLITSRKIICSSGRPSRSSSR